MDVRSRPWLVEFAGTPRAGKTTVMRGLSRWLIEDGLRVRVVEEQAPCCPVPGKDNVHFNLWTGASTIREIVQGFYSDADVVLVDRGLFDALCWLEWYSQRGRLSTVEHQCFDGLLRAPTMTDLVDLVVVMIVDPLLALRRDSTTRSRHEPGAIMNCETLEAINHSIGAASKRCAADFQLESVDTTGMSEAEALSHVTDIVRRSRPSPGSLRHVVRPGPDGRGS